MSYQPYVAELLEGKAEVVGPAVNCRYALFTLSSLNDWIEELGPPDIVHWNNGIHDCGHDPDRSPVQMPIEIYRDNLAFILKRLKALTPRIIWATTTPVHPDRPFRKNEWAWRNQEINQYNQVARELMEANKIPINDLYALAWKNREKFLAEDQLHLSEAGQKASARAVAEAVSLYLPKR